MKKTKKIDGRKFNSPPKLPAGEKKKQVATFVREKVLNTLGHARCKEIAELSIENKYKEIMQENNKTT